MIYLIMFLVSALIYFIAAIFGFFVLMKEIKEQHKVSKARWENINLNYKK